MTTPLDWFYDILDCFVWDHEDYDIHPFFYHSWNRRLPEPTPLDWFWDIIECFINEKGNQIEEAE